MSDFHLIIRGGWTVLPEGERQFDIGIRDGRIEAMGATVFGSTDADLDATGFHVLPGVVDASVRLGAGAVGVREGAWALAAGGITTYLDLGDYAVRDRAEFEARQVLGQAESLSDFALWGAMTADNLGQLEDLAEAGVIGYQACLADGGGLPVIDDGALLEGMMLASDLRQVVSVHAENQAMTARFARAAAAAGRISMRDYLDSRPVIAELEAVQRAILLAWEADCALHFAGVSTGRAVELIAGAKAQGLNVSCSTAPHYLLLTEADAERLGSLAKSAPPLRPLADVNALWTNLASGQVDLIASGHAPGGSNEPNAFAAPAAIAGGQSMLSSLLAEAFGVDHPVPLAKLSDLLSTNPARRFRLHPRKGELAVGADADAVIIDLHETSALQAETLFSQPAANTPYLGRPVRGRILRTLVRGRTVFREGKIVGKAEGRLVEPV